MRAFPGCFPPDIFDRLTLEHYAESYALAVAVLEEEAEATRAAMNRTQ